MRILETFPFAVREIENCWIPMPDGARLAARIWLPENATSRPVPAVVEYIPYRKRDRTRWRDEPIHRYFAGHGYAAVRIDLRGAGESDGLLLDEYLDQELDDGVAAIRWIASQPWCTGVVGMMGKSWGGFNALQVAARRPPELAAILTVCSTDDRYTDDAHYMGGCLLNENLLWGSALLTINAQPPDPELVGDRWRDMWRERLEECPLFVEQWLRHPHRDDYWKHGSVCEDYDRIACPVFAVGGWADAYTNAVPRLLAGLSVPRKGLVGPWAHLYPHEGVPGPAVGFLQEAVRWWDHWLKGADTGIMDEPMYRVWMHESVAPRTYYDTRPGRWVSERAWPSPQIEPVRFYLGEGTLSAERPPPATLSLSSPETTGTAGGRWCSFGVEGDLPGDQRPDDARSLVFESEPLKDRLEILGAPKLTVTLSANRPVAMLVARLNDVAPDGAVTRVTYGVLNLTHRDSHERPSPLEPGTRCVVELALNDIAYAFPPGHRIRLALSTAYWPMVWPAPARVRLSVETAAGELTLPVRPTNSGDERLRPFEPPESAPPLDHTDLEDGGIRRTVGEDAHGFVTITTVLDRTATGGVALSHVKAIDLAFGHGVIERYRIHPGDPLSARAEVSHEVVARRGAWSIKIQTSTVLTGSAQAFQVEAVLRAFEGEEIFCERRWSAEIPRNLL